MANATARKLAIVKDDGRPSRTAEKGPRSPARASAAERRRDDALAERQRAGLVARVVAVGCLVGLLLSGIDSALALMEFMHIYYVRAAMLATVIDGLMVGAEIAVLISTCEKVKRSAYTYIGMAGVLSVCLNAAEFGSHASASPYHSLTVLNCVTGGLIPLLVLVSSRYAGYLYLYSQSGSAAR